MPIDRQRLVDIAFGDVELADQLLTIYTERAHNIAEALRACDPAAGDKLADLAHGIRGSALAIGATGVAELALRCEQAFREEETPARAKARDALVAGIEASARESAAAPRGA